MLCFRSNHDGKPISVFRIMIVDKAILKENINVCLPIELIVLSANNQSSDFLSDEIFRCVDQK